METENIKLLSEYKQLKVVNAKNYRKDNIDILASYNSKSETITIYPDFYNRGDITKKRALYHEYGHHVNSKMSMVNKTIWKLISNWKLLGILNAFWLTQCTKNAFVRDYWKTNHKEDFATVAEELERQRLQSERIFHNFADFKLKVVKSLIRKFEK
mgnify:CR=1 FL=1